MAIDALALGLASDPGSPHRFWFRLDSDLHRFWWLSQPNRVAATALFEVRNEQASLVARDSDQMFLSKEEFEIMKKYPNRSAQKQVRAIHRRWNPGIASLSVLGSSDDKEAWLQDHLEIEYPHEGEILSISLHGPESQKDDLTALVDAIAAAYKKEVLSQERQRRLTIRDMLSKSLENLTHEIKRKSEDYLDIAKSLDRPDGTNNDPLKEINTKRLDRIDAELMRLEGEQLKNETAGDKQDTAFLAKRLEQLGKQKEELEKAIRLSTVRTVELETRGEELKQLQSMANDMTIKLEALDIDLQVPPRIRQVQSAAISPSNTITASGALAE